MTLAKPGKIQMLKKYFVVSCIVSIPLKVFFFGGGTLPGHFVIGFFFNHQTILSIS